MVLINIHDEIGGVIDVDEFFTNVTLEGLYELLFPQEIGIEIAENLSEAEYKITQEILDEEINDYLKDIHESIIDSCIGELATYGIRVY